MSELALAQSGPTWVRAELADREFRTFAKLIYERSGIALSIGKRSMLEGRLRRRLQARGLHNFQDYVRLLEDEAAQGDEVQALIDAVTTNQTAFFREPAHFEYLIDGGLARLVADRDGPLRVWSAACSTGEEPYTLAMVLAQHLPAQSDRGFSMLATDISLRVLEAASRGIYRAEDAAAIAAPYRSRYLLRARDRGLELVRVAPELRRLVRFGQINLTDSQYHVGGSFDLVFCRNVLIYFDQPTQERVLRQLCRHLRPGGLLCLGHADTTSNADLPLRLIRSSMHERLADEAR